MDNPIGTTSACAENTDGHHHHSSLDRNYLRVRGEYQIVELSPYPPMELPPRARRIQEDFSKAVDDFGTTSACAENTINARNINHHARNYLRVRGEYVMRRRVGAICWELPPRARRIQTLDCFESILAGTTSACAENTKPRKGKKKFNGNYLRVRGEYLRVSQM